MSVPKSQRGQSAMEFYHNALILRQEITALLLRDFGLKKKVRTVEILTKMYNIEPTMVHLLKIKVLILLETE